MRVKAVVVGVGIALLCQGLYAHERSWPAKRLKSLWPEASKFTSNQVTLSGDQLEKLARDSVKLTLEDKTPTFYFAQVKEQDTGKLATAGVIIFIDEYGANDRMEISVGVTPEGRIAKLDLWQHSEDKRVAQADFLRQFMGEKHGDSLEAGKGFQPVKGAERASRAVARAARKALAIIDAVYGKPKDSKPEEK